MNIIRPQTDSEKKDFTSLYVDDPNRKFKKELVKQATLAHKKGLPFAEKVAQDEFNEVIQTQAKESLKLHGKVNIEDIKIPTMDWEKYSDLKNFTLINTKKVRDKYLSTLHKMPIFIESKEYKFKGYGNIYRMMEDGDVALAKHFKKEANLRK